MGMTKIELDSDDYDLELNLEQNKIQYGTVLRTKTQFILDDLGKGIRQYILVDLGSAQSKFPGRLVMDTLEWFILSTNFNKGPLP